MVLAVVAIFGFAVPVSVAVVAMAPSASASSSLTCGKLKGTAAGSVTLSKCSVSKANKKLYKSLTAPSALSLATGGTLTWSSSGKTVSFGTPVDGTPPNACGSKASEISATGTISAGDGVVTFTGDTFSIFVCEKTKGGKLSLAPGTVASL
jgi:hypothetical protein